MQPRLIEPELLAEIMASRLDGEAKVLALVLLQHAEDDEVCRVGYERLAALAGASKGTYEATRKTIERLLVKLEEAGWAQRLAKSGHVATSRHASAGRPASGQPATPCPPVAARPPDVPRPVDQPPDVRSTSRGASGSSRGVGGLGGSVATSNDSLEHQNQQPADDVAPLQLAPAEPRAPKPTRGLRARRTSFDPTDAERATMERINDELLRLRAAACWPKRSLTVCETHCTGLLWCLRRGLSEADALDMVRATLWVHSTSGDMTNNGRHAELTTMFGERTQGEDRRLRAAKYLAKWIDEGRPPPQPRGDTQGKYTKRGMVSYDPVDKDPSPEENEQQVREAFQRAGQGW
jgi:hypothetical protein